MRMIMVDDNNIIVILKVINILTKTSSQICYICKCNPTNNMNDLDNMHNFQVNFKNGLSTLYAWIEFLKFVFHIAYKLESDPIIKKKTII